MYKVLVIDQRSTQENPIKPIEVIATDCTLSSCLSQHLSPDTYCVVSFVEQYKSPVD